MSTYRQPFRPYQWKEVLTYITLVPVVLPAPAATTIYDLNNDLLKISHSLLGIRHFRFAGIACKLLLDANLAVSDEKVTSMKSVTFSISCAEKYFADEGTGYEQLKIFWCSAARYAVWKL